MYMYMYLDECIDIEVKSVIVLVFDLYISILKYIVHYSYVTNTLYKKDKNFYNYMYVYILLYTGTCILYNNIIIYT